MKETIRIELTQGQYQQLKEIGVSNSEIKSYGCTHPSSGVTIDHYMTVGVKTRVTGGNHTIDNIDTTPIQVESLAGGAEWKNGDECTAECLKQYEKCIWVGYGRKKELSVVECLDGAIWSLDRVWTAELRKPETEAERNDRERLEAAYDLYVIAQLAIDGDVIDYSDFVKESRQMRGALAIIDKTGYRKAVTNE